MRHALLDHLLDPRTGSALRLEVFSGADGEVVEGVLHADDGYWYPICGGVPRLLAGPLRDDHSEFALRHALPAIQEASPSGTDEAGRATRGSFSEKWNRFGRFGLEEAQREFLLEWCGRKLGCATREELAAFFAAPRRILEVGTGSGYLARYAAGHTPGLVFAVDLSDAAVTTYENTRDLPNCHTVQADLMQLPFAPGYFDLVIADGVLHHTPDTSRALAALYERLAPGGRMFFYVYRRMGPARQFCDRHIRDEFTGLDAESCFEACRGLTELGRELSRLQATITLGTPIPILGIPAGTHDVQRLIYYTFVKCFWNDAFDFETNNLVNFDWYHPRHAWQHTEEEVESWLRGLGVREYRFNPANPNGISVLLSKPAEQQAPCPTEPPGRSR